MSRPKIGRRIVRGLRDVLRDVDRLRHIGYWNPGLDERIALDYLHRLASWYEKRDAERKKGT